MATPDTTHTEQQQQQQNAAVIDAARKFKQTILDHPQLRLAAIRSDWTMLIPFMVAQTVIQLLIVVIGVTVTMAALVTVTLITWQLLQAIAQRALNAHPTDAWPRKFEAWLGMVHTTLVLGSFNSVIQLFFYMVQENALGTVRTVFVTLIAFSSIILIFRIPRAMDSTAYDDALVYGEAVASWVQLDSAARQRPVKTAVIVSARANSEDVSVEMKLLAPASTGPHDRKRVPKKVTQTAKIYLDEHEDAETTSEPEDTLRKVARTPRRRPASNK